jgi:hypothetical protein
MNGHNSLSSREKYQHFFYLLILTIIVVVILYVIVLRKRESPFDKNLSFEIQMLEQKKKFVQHQQNIYPYLEKTFKKIDEMPLQYIQVFTETDIKNSVNNIANAQNDLKINDPRKEGFLQIAQFYKAYFEDKKIAEKKSENITLFEKQFNECKIGYKEKEQQLSQKNTALLSRYN